MSQKNKIKTVVSVKFRKNPKEYYFEAGDFIYAVGAGIVVETSKGLEYAKVFRLPFELDISNLSSPLKPVKRLATEDDEKRLLEHVNKTRSVVLEAQGEIEKSGLDMQAVDAEFTLDGGKLIIYFTSEQRVDFRELLKKLAQYFKMRVELKQIGSRDECRAKGGLGVCGRVCCCNGAMKDFAHVSIKMAKNQGLSLNPQKISGLCGRLMCCLAYENHHYGEINKRMPKVGAKVKTKDGKEGTVNALLHLKEQIKIKIVDKDTFTFTNYPLNEVTFKPRGNKEEN